MSESQRTAVPELEVLLRYEDVAAWLLAHTGRWPRSARFSFASRLQNLVLETAERLVVARYEPGRRAAELREVNLALERMRLLLRLARAQGVTGGKAFESAVRSIDEVGRMVHGWRSRTGATGR